MENHQISTQHSTNVQYVGVRQRKWGKWVSEIREQGTKTRIWLGSYEAPEMAAAAYDVAALKLRGSRARLNFPELMDSFPKPKSSNPEDIQVAAQEAATRFKRPLEISLNRLGSCDLRPITVKLSPSQIQAINESPLESPKMWMEPHLDYDHLREWDEMLLGSIWND